MRVYGLLSWFDEEPSWLSACVASMSKLCSDVIAFDGAYGLYPSLEARSAPVQAETIARTADALGMAWTIHVPQEKWWEGEVSKRAAMLALAATLATPSDWLLVLDADEILRDVWSGTRGQLLETDLDVAELTIVDAWGGRAPIRRLFRALPGITCEETHYNVKVYEGSSPRYLAGDPLNAAATFSPALPMLDLTIQHRGEDRTPERKAAKAAYYERAIPLEQAKLIGGGTDAQVVR